MEWHFTIRGPVGTEFEGGVYHGRIVLPPEYPFKPPNIMFLSPSGRFDVRKMICLSISAFHPETWQPAWGSACRHVDTLACESLCSRHQPLSYRYVIVVLVDVVASLAVRLILEALISFLPTPGEGAVGAIDMPAEDRRRIAAQVWLRAHNRPPPGLQESDP